jgi:ADP-ribose pyrophosphatase
LASRRVFDGKVVSVRVDTVRLPDGNETLREVVEHSPSVVVVPIDAEDNVIMVRQYRYPAGEALLEAPAGGVEESEAPEECAQRELREETGYVARDLKSLGRFWASPGYCTEVMYAYVARDLDPSPLEPDADETIDIERVPVSRVARLIRQGEIQDAKSIAALLMATCV